MLSNKRKPNRLAKEKSPYLLQHAYNPVDWYPWGDEALRKAAEEDKPIFLSIGYSTCHWCHVMEKESFSDPKTSALLNDVCIPIKVDREERPDLDGVFMAASQVMNNSGGWPLNVFLTPDGKPFFAGTYIPRNTVGKVPGMMDILPRVKWLWSTQRDEVAGSADSVVDSLRKGSMLEPGAIPGKDTVERCFDELAKNFDDEWGGFYGAPKFAMPGILLFLLQHWQNFGDPAALDMVDKTLTMMSLGGIHDHLGGGFHRYSTDRNWMKPHFEKMLYDQALLMTIYAKALQVTGEPLFAETIDGIARYVGLNMTSPEGAFYSAEDADSDGEEGKFYTWKYGEVLDLLGAEAAAFTDIYNISEDGNLDGMQGTVERSRNVMFLSERPDTDIAESLAHSRRKLLGARAARRRPFRDEKILVDWNGMMIAALALAGRITGNEDYVSMAERAALFILDKMITSEGKLLHCYIGGKASVDAFLDDYAFLIWGLIELFKAGKDESVLQKVFPLLNKMTELFWDGEKGGFYSTEDGADGLFFRRKEAYDGAILAPNSVAMDNFVELAKLTGKDEFNDMAKILGKAFGRQAESLPSSHSYLLAAVLKMEKG